VFGHVGDEPEGVREQQRGIRLLAEGRRRAVPVLSRKRPTVLELQMKRRKMDDEEDSSNVSEEYDLKVTGEMIACLFVTPLLE